MAADLRHRLEALVAVAARLARAESSADAVIVATREGVGAIGGRGGAFGKAGDRRGAEKNGPPSSTRRGADASSWRALSVTVRTNDDADRVLSAEFPAADEESARHLLGSLAELLAAALERAALHAAAQRANEAKDVFLATVTHELRGPLAAISMWTHVLGLKACDDATRARAAQAIDESVRAQGRLIEEMIDFSRLRTGKLRVDLARLSVAHVVGLAVDDAAAAASTKGVTLALHAGDEAFVLGDARRLRQVFYNLLSNAIEFTPNGGRVDVTLSRAGDRAHVVVRDDGEGMSATFLAQAFEPFHQEDDSLTRRRGGLGLGLAVASQIVALHGGIVRAESAGRGEGATFSVELPLVTPASPGSDR